IIGPMLRVSMLVALVSAQPQGPVEVKLQVGETYSICEAKVMICPAVAPICDDPKVAAPEGDPKRGLLWKGVGSGQTLCSASTPGHPGGVRRVFHIRVQ